MALCSSQTTDKHQPALVCRAAKTDYAVREARQSLSFLAAARLALEQLKERDKLSRHDYLIRPLYSGRFFHS